VVRLPAGKQIFFRAREARLSLYSCAKWRYRIILYRDDIFNPLTRLLNTLLPYNLISLGSLLHVGQRRSLAAYKLITSTPQHLLAFGHRSFVFQVSSSLY
jgi:hypothetical protein